MKYLCSSKRIFQAPLAIPTRHVSTCDFTLQLQWLLQKLSWRKLNCFLLRSCEGNASVEFLIRLHRVFSFTFSELQTVIKIYKLTEILLQTQVSIIFHKYAICAVLLYVAVQTKLLSIPKVWICLQSPFRWKLQHWCCSPFCALNIWFDIKSYWTAPSFPSVISRWCVFNQLPHFEKRGENSSSRNTWNKNAQCLRT